MGRCVQTFDWLCVCVFFNVLMGGKSAKNYCVVCYRIM